MFKGFSFYRVVLRIWAAGLIGLTVLIGVLFAIDTTSAGAVSLGIDPSLTNVEVYNPFDVDIIISGLKEEPAALSLGAFDLNLNFDKSTMFLENCHFGNELNFVKPTDPDLLKIWNDGTYQGLRLSSGKINLWQVSLDTTEHLNSLQPSSFTLATLTFLPFKSGTSSLAWDLDPSSMILTNAQGDSIPDNVTDFTLTGATVIVGHPVCVPVSSGFISILLLAVGIIGIAGIQRMQAGQGGQRVKVMQRAKGDGEEMLATGAENFARSNDAVQD
jgi:hypothetical protein